MEDQDQEEREDAYEKARKVLLIVGLALQFYVLWDYLKDQPEYELQKRKILHWWDKKVAAPRRRAKKLRKMETETVFEAIMALDEEEV